MKTLLPLAVSAAVLGMVQSASEDTYILVHGAFQDASGWQAIIPALKAAGHDIVAVDLPGRDLQGEAAKTVTLAGYIDTVASAVTEAEAPVHLVGHSFGGMTISGVAEAIPAKIETLVYVAAYLPKDGESMEKLAYSDADNGFPQETFVIAKDYSHATLLKPDQARVFANDGTDAQKAALEASMIREPLAPIGTPIALTDENFGGVDKAYIRTLRDQTVSTQLQTMMIERAGLTRVQDIETGHAPYLTAPDTLADDILTLTQ